MSNLAGKAHYDWCVEQAVLVRCKNAGWGSSPLKAMLDIEQLRRSIMQTAAGVESFLSLLATKGLIVIQRER